MPPSPGSTNAKAQCLPADSCESPPKSAHELAPEPAPEVPHETGQSTRRVLRTDSGSATGPPWDATPPPTQQLAFSIGLPRTTTPSAPASPRRRNIRTFHQSLQLGPLVYGQHHRPI